MHGVSITPFPADEELLQLAQDIFRLHRKSCRCLASVTGSDWSCQVCSHSTGVSCSNALCPRTIFFFFCFLVDTASTGLLWWFCSCPWPSQFLLWFTALFWLSGMDVVVDLLPMLVPVLMSCFFPQSGTCHFSSTKEMLHPESSQSKCFVLNETFLCSSVMV